LWDYIHGRITACKAFDGYSTTVGKPWVSALRAYHVLHDYKPADEFSDDMDVVTNAVKKIIMQGSYARVYGWLQYVMEVLKDKSFSAFIERILVHCRAPYRVVDGYVIFPIASEEDSATVVGAFADLQKAGLSGAREHLK
jgi:hypothetical protein